MADEYTPTTEQVRETYAALCKTDAAAAEFDRWLAEVKAEAWDRGYEGPAEMTNPYCKGGAS